MESWLLFLLFFVSVVLLNFVYRENKKFRSSLGGNDEEKEVLKFSISFHSFNARQRKFYFSYN